MCLLEHLQDPEKLVHIVSQLLKKLLMKKKYVYLLYFNLAYFITKNNLRM